MLTQLIRLGLPEKEAKVYLAALELGSQTAQAIARTAGVNRATTYVILQSLIKKGLVSMFSVGHKTSFAAEAPENLDHLLRKQEEDIFERRRDLEKMIPELRALHRRAPGKPRVRFFEGDEGVRLMLAELRRGHEPPAAIKVFLADGEPAVDLPAVLASLGTESQVRIIASGVGRKIAAWQQVSASAATRWLSGQEFPFETSVVIAPTRHLVSLIGRRHDPVGMTFDNPELVRTLESIFDALWQRLKDR